MRKKKLTIMVDEDVYGGLHAVVGRRNTSRFISDLAWSHHAVASTLDEGYRAMAADEEREAEALGWSEGLIGDVANEPR